MATANKDRSITKKDIEDFRELIEIQKKFDKITKALARKLDCEFYEISEWSERLSKTKAITDEQVIFAMGRMCCCDL